MAFDTRIHKLLVSLSNDPDFQTFMAEVAGRFKAEAVQELLSATEPVFVGRAQGQVAAIDKLIDAVAEARKALETQQRNETAKGGF